MPTATFTSDDTYDDGRAFNDSVTLTWAQIRDGAGNGAQTNVGTTQYAFLQAATTSNRWDSDYRGIFTTDSSSLTAAANISSAVFSFYPTAKTNDFTSGLSMILAAPAATDTFVSGDYDNFTFTKQATDLAISGITTSARNEFTLNATGLSNISKTGASKFGFTTSHTADNSEPTWASGQPDSGVSWENRGGANPPQLIVTYTVGGYLGWGYANTGYW